MKRFLGSFKIYNFLWIALIIRLLFLPLTFHSDLNTNSIWGVYAHEFGLRGYYDWLSFGNYARPEYPPLSTIVFLVLRVLYESLFSIFWKVNALLPIFPSEMIVWLDRYGYMGILKLPGVIADLGIGYMIYKFTKKRLFANFYLFNPAVIYLSAIWGQTESVVGFFGLVALLYLTVNKYVSSFWSMFVSLMIKATMVPLSGVLVFEAIRKRMGVRNVMMIVICFLAALFVVGYIFTDHAFISWTIRSYVQKFMTGAHSQRFLNLNAFNFWGLIFGQMRIPDQAYLVPAYVLTVVFYVITFIRYIKRKDKDIFFLALLVFYMTFLFLPRMHERYLYPIFVFFPFVLAKTIKLKRIFYLASGVFLVNLMSGWTIPVMPEVVFRGLSAVNLGIFGYLLWKYLS